MNKELILQSLVEANSLFGANKDPNDLQLLTDLFDEAFEGEDERRIMWAFKRQRKVGHRFPYPADIIELSYQCPMPRQQEALEEAGTRTPGYGAAVCKELRRRLRTGGLGEDASVVCHRIMIELTAQKPEEPGAPNEPGPGAAGQEEPGAPKGSEERGGQKPDTPAGDKA